LYINYIRKSLTIAPSAEALALGREDKTKSKSEEQVQTPVSLLSTLFLKLLDSF
jgi:hypothetical protein